MMVYLSSWLEPVAQFQPKAKLPVVFSDEGVSQLLAGVQYVVERNQKPMVLLNDSYCMVL